MPAAEADADGLLRDELVPRLDARLQILPGELRATLVLLLVLLLVLPLVLLVPLMLILLQPPYGLGFGFHSTQSSNMVLQQAPAKAAVYGIAVGKPTAVTITFSDKSGNAPPVTVTAQVGVNVTQQPFGPGFDGMSTTPSWGMKIPGAKQNTPWLMWKAFLPPTPAGGDYEILAKCTGCTEDGSYSSANITNVTFGDVWHCSGAAAAPAATRFACSCCCSCCCSR